MPKEKREIEQLFVDEAVETVWSFVRNEVDCGVLSWGAVQKVLHQCLGRALSQQELASHREWLKGLRS